MNGPVVWVDGSFVDADHRDDPASGVIAPFETMGAWAGKLPLWDRHMARLQATLLRLGADFDGQGLRVAAGELLQRNGHRDGVLRLVQAPGPGGGCTTMASRAREQTKVVRLLPTVSRRPVDAAPADWKVRPRTFYDAVLAEARAGGANDGIVLGDDGALLETAVGNLWLLLDDIWVTPPADGRILPGIARAVLLDAAGGPLRTVERVCDLGDLHRAVALMVSNAAHGPRPAALVGATVANYDASLVARWRSTVSD